MNIGLDVMGGDFAPDATIDGAMLALDELPSNDSIFLFGDEAIIRQKLTAIGFDSDRFEIVHAPDTIGMAEHPIKAFTQKSKSSIATGFQYLKNNQIDSFASSGNSGALIIGSMYTVKTIDGIIRPCTSVVCPNEDGGHTLVLDIGTNPEPKPDVLYQFGILGNIYAKHVFNIKTPRIALLNIGEEEEKGNMLMQTTYQLMKDNRDFNFVGNVEGRDIMNGKADVIVSDGFTGNVVLKLIESFHKLLKTRGLADDYIEKLDFKHQGGSPILGINASVVVGHGISDDMAIKNMILLSKNIHEAHLFSRIKEAFSRYA
ncbi:MAG: phosphate--acyl-ACP acyltransferase [Bacteroidota bacterium]|nr:phosphate--acyl-ACP acyltransferase [Bacteroidota bacterium]